MSLPRCVRCVENVRLVTGSDCTPHNKYYELLDYRTLKGRRMILVDEHTALMEQDDLDALGEYSCSIPTGTAIGKRWKRGGPCECVSRRLRRYGTCQEHSVWTMGEYAVHDDPELVKILWREIIVV